MNTSYNIIFRIDNTFSVLSILSHYLVGNMARTSAVGHGVKVKITTNDHVNKPMRMPPIKFSKRPVPNLRSFRKQGSLKCVESDRGDDSRTRVNTSSLVLGALGSWRLTGVRLPPSHLNNLPLPSACCHVALFLLKVHWSTLSLQLDHLLPQLRKVNCSFVW
jgi:hypothetical protein